MNLSQHSQLPCPKNSEGPMAPVPTGQAPSLLDLPGAQSGSEQHAEIAIGYQTFHLYIILGVSLCTTCESMVVSLKYPHFTDEEGNRPRAHTWR